MLRYLLDTNILSDLVRHPDGPVSAAIGEVGEDRVCTSIVVAAELRFGAVKRGSVRLQDLITGLLARLEVLPLESPADHTHAEVRSALEAMGTPIGPNDTLIAAQALTLGLTLVTANDAEFRRVPGLMVENWLAATPGGQRSG